MRAIQRGIAWGLTFLCVILLLPCTALADAIPVTVKSAKQDGTVRVRLDTLGTSGNYTLTVSGSYSIGGVPLSSGAKLSVRFSGGSFSVTRNGATENMGAGFKLVRTGSGSDGGIKISEASTAANLYSGDLEFLVRGGVPYVICHVFIEDYLYGVVPYEMSNSFPLEALKAQAVTARTYALRRMASASGNYYDLRDTTSDQVYRGTPGGNSNSKSAVDGTAGQVLMYGSDYCAVYYSSSNGGQTESAEHAWGGSGYAYLSLKDDPYDLANPNATVRRATVYSAFTNNSTAIQNLLAQRLLAQHGVSVAITGIESIVPESPKYAQPSRLYTQMRFMLRCGNGQAYAVTVPIFGTLDGALGLSMSGLQNELFTVESTSAGYRILARRYGHGVGLSQYGASQMASQNLDYLSILGFYFEGATLVQHSFVHEDGTAGPTPGPTAPDGAGIGQATVVLSNPSNSLNLRSQPNTRGTVLAGIPHGATVTVYTNADGWAQVRYGGLTGYVSTAYLQFGTSGATAAPNANTAVVTLSSGSLNLRARESVTAERLTSIPNGMRVTVLDQGSVWTRVEYGIYTGYVMTAYLRFDSPSATPTPTPTPTPSPAPSAGPTVARVILAEAGDRLNLRSQPNTLSTVVAKIPNNQEVAVLMRGTVWSQVRYGDAVGYVMTQYLSFADTAPTPTPTPSPTPTGTQSATTATVRLLQPGSTLNLRQFASTKAEVLARIPNGAAVTVQSHGPTWCGVTYQGIHGYVVTEYLNFGGAAPAPTPTPGPSAPAQGDAWVLTLSGTGNVNLRAAMRVDAQILARIPHGQKVSLRGDYGDWCEVNHQGIVGYISSAYVSKTAPSSGSGGSVPAGGSSSGMSGLAINYARIKLESERSTLNLRSTASADATVVSKVDHGERVEVLDYTPDGIWASVRHNGAVGFASRSYLRLEYATAVVRLSDPNSSLTLRAAANADAQSLAKLDHGSIVTVIEPGASWTRIRVAGGHEGYVATSYLNIQ